MFDVFYIGRKPGLFAHEQQVESITAAQRASRTRFCWIITYLSDYSDFDFLWEPPPWQSHFTHVWPSQWHAYSGTYLVPARGDIEYHFQSIIVPNRSRPEEFGVLDPHMEFDFTWSPHPLEPAYHYVFGNQWWPSTIMGTVEYAVQGASQYKFMTEPRARLLPRQSDRWKKLVDCEFDFSWTPDPGDPAYIYVFGNQWHDAEIMPTLEYHVPGAHERKFMNYPRARLLPDRSLWSMPSGIDPDSVDFSWVPDPGSPPYIYQFGTQWQKTGGPRYVMPGASDIKYSPRPRSRRTSIDDCWQTPPNIDPDSFDWTWHPDDTEQPYIYQFGTQWQKTGGPRYVMPGATEIKFISAPRAQKITRDDHWHIPEGAVYGDDFDWTWHPDATEQPYIYQFGTQHQKTGGPRYTVPGATEVKYVDQVRVTVKAAAAPVYIIDHVDGNSEHTRQEIAGRATIAKTVRYVDNYLDTLRRIAAGVDYHTEYIWICSTVCDYKAFDFTWYPEQWQATMLHVFASDGEKFGDTFFMHVPTFLHRSETCQLLEWYDVNFVEGVSVPRRVMPVVVHDQDSHVDAIKNTSWSGPLAVFSNRAIDRDLPAVPLWREKTKTLVPLDTGAGAVIVPKVAVPYIRTQAYDYPHIDKTHMDHLQAQSLDVVFISNGEPNAEENWQRLQEVMEQHPNTVHRVDGVNGRVAAYQAAANASTTPWFFAVFAKLYVSGEFDWAWQPDRLQQPKHYIFHARNDVTGLEYGHQAMIAYNKCMTLENTAPGLDFTLDQPHEVVPIFSGSAKYAYTPWMAWRTAFREAIKLKHSLPDVENDYRLRQWLTVGRGDNGVFSVMGAQDAVDYYDKVSGEFAELRKTYEWSWLSAYAMMIRPTLFS